MRIQDEINNEYPPTHTFIIKDLVPTIILKERINLINRYFPGFFKGERFLDIGCSFGFFSLSNSSNFKKIIGIDINQKSIKICNLLKIKENINFFPVSFRNFIIDKQFDKIFLGNGPHHLFKEINGHEWIIKLAALSSNEVLIEGPINTECLDIKDFPKEFNNFMNQMDKYFKLIKMYPSVSYTPNRFLMLWKKKEVKLKPRNFKKYYKNDIYTTNDRVTLFIASSSPVSNGLTGFFGNGWLEEFSNSDIYKYNENEKELFKLHCDNEIYLAKLGYWDMDSATINFFKENNKLFDKSAIIPISIIDLKYILGYQKLLRQSYKTIPLIVQTKIETALFSKDPNKIMEAFIWAKKQV